MSVRSEATARPSKASPQRPQPPIASRLPNLSALVLATDMKRKADQLEPVMPKFTQYKKQVKLTDIFSAEGRFYEQDPSGVTVAVAKKFKWRWCKEGVGTEHIPLNANRPRTREYEAASFDTPLSGNEWPLEAPQYMYVLGPLQPDSTFVYPDYTIEKRMDSEAVAVERVSLDSLDEAARAKLAASREEILNSQFEIMSRKAAHNRRIKQLEEEHAAFVLENGREPELMGEEARLHSSSWNSSSKYDHKKDKWTYGKRSEYEQSLLTLPFAPEDFQEEFETIVYKPVKPKLSVPARRLYYVLWIATEKQTGIRRLFQLSVHTPNLEFVRGRIGFDKYAGVPDAVVPYYPLPTPEAPEAPAVPDAGPSAPSAPSEEEQQQPSTSDMPLPMMG